MIDEVHVLGEDRGHTLEVVVSRIKTMQAHTAVQPNGKHAPLSSIRIVAVSATIPNLRELGTWLQAPAGCRKP